MIIAIAATNIIPTNNLLFINPLKSMCIAILPFSDFIFLITLIVLTTNNIIISARIILGQNAAPSSVGVAAGDSLPTKIKQ